MLDDKTIWNRIRELTEVNPFTGEAVFEINPDRINDIPKVFKQLMQEERNKNKGIKYQFTLLDDVIEGFAVNETDRQIFNQYSDNKHMSYFDIFLEEGQADEILNILNKYELNADILKGIQLKEYDNKNGDIEIIQHLEESTENSLEVDYFIIKYKGKIIYKWDREDGVIINEPIENKKPIQKETKSVYEKTILSHDDGIVKEWVTKTGRKQYRNEKGRFVKNPYEY